MVSTLYQCIESVYSGQEINANGRERLSCGGWRRLVLVRKFSTWVVPGTHLAGFLTVLTPKPIPRPTAPSQGAPVIF